MSNNDESYSNYVEAGALKLNPTKYARVLRIASFVMLTVIFLFLGNHNVLSFIGLGLITAIFIVIKYLLFDKILTGKKIGLVLSVVIFAGYSLFWTVDAIEDFYLGNPFHAVRALVYLLLVVGAVFATFKQRRYEEWLEEQRLIEIENDKIKDQKDKDAALEAKRIKEQEEYDAQTQKFNELVNSASSGNANSQHELALMYLTGTGPFPFPIEKDTAKAIELLEKSAGQGNISSQIELGRHYSSSGYYDFNKAMLYLKKAAEAGDLEAQYLLGDLYLTAKSNDGSTPNCKQAAFWWGKAAANDHVKSMLKLSILHQLSPDSINSFEKFVPDPNQGVELLKRILNKKLSPSSEAELYLGVMHFGGEHIEKNEQEGIKLIKSGFGSLYLHGLGKEKSEYNVLLAETASILTFLGRRDLLKNNDPYMKRELYTESVDSFGGEYVKQRKKILTSVKEMLDQEEKAKKEAEIRSLESSTASVARDLANAISWLDKNISPGGKWDYYHEQMMKTLKERLNELHRLNNKHKGLIKELTGQSSDEHSLHLAPILAEAGKWCMIDIQLGTTSNSYTKGAIAYALRFG